MQTCPQCGFHHSDADTRCLRCGARLRTQTATNPLAAHGEEELDFSPPRRLPGANALARLGGVLGRAWYFGRRALQSDLPADVHFRNPWIALGLSLALPGAGQWYNQQPKRAVIIFLYALGAVLLGVFTWFHPSSNYYLLGALLTWIYAAHDAFMTAKAINRDVVYWTTNVAFYTAWVLLLCLMLIGGQHVLATFLIKFRAITHDEMRPYLRKGERIALDRWTYLWSEPKIGDMVWVTNLDSRHPRVLKLETPSNEVLLVNPRAYMERIVGLPGDSFERRAGVFYRNGRPVPRREQPLITTQILDDFSIPAKPDKYIILMTYVGDDVLDVHGQGHGPRLFGGEYAPQNWVGVNYVPRSDIHARAWFVYQPPPMRRWLE